jgi:ankyrin repeat protein
MVAFLLSKGADVNRKNRLIAETPLMAASEMGKLDTAKALLDHGADPCATDKEGNTAAGLAKKYGHGDIAEYLSSRFGCQEKVIDSCADPSVSACVHP